MKWHVSRRHVLVGFQRDMDTPEKNEVRGLFVRAWRAERGVDGRILG